VGIAGGRVYNFDSTMSRGRGIKIALVAVVVLVVLAVGALFLLAKPMARRIATEQARAHGIDLAFENISFGFGWAKVENATFSLVGFPRIHGTIRQIDVTLSGLTPTEIRSLGMDVEAEGSAPTLVLGIVEWTEHYPHTFKLPAEAAEMTVTWRQDPGGEPFAKLTGGSVRRAASGATFVSEHALLGACPAKADGAPSCPDLGNLGAVWTATDASVTFGFGEADVNRAPVRVEVKPKGERPTAEITLSPVDARKLAGPFGVTLPVKDLTASGSVHLDLPKGESRAPITGTLDAKLDGFVPPHPRELDGFVFGDSTTFASKLAIDQKREHVDFSESKLAAGSFKLAGAGTLDREADHGHAKMTLSGSLPCDALAGAAANTYLGKTLGGIAGKLARQFVGGSVGITVKIDALTNDLPHMKVTPVIGIGCGLKPLKLSDLDPTKLGLPPLPSSLPPLPSGLPALPPPPKLDFPFPAPPKPAPKKDDTKTPP
jgi:ADP-dependent NAD(P)H-hydrate dehydratase / NAD(P)H-hydrate epimerase